MTTGACPHDVVVTGIGVVSPIGSGVKEFTEALRKGRNGIARIEGFDTTGFRSTSGGEIKLLPAEFDGARRVERKPVDRASCLALLAAREAVQTSGMAGTHDSGGVGLSFGSCAGGYLGGLDYYSARMQNGNYRASRLLDLPLHSAACRMAAEFQFHGPVSLLSNACASSAVAVAWAAEQIRSGLVTAMLAGGYEALTPLNCAGFGSMRNSSPSNTLRPFDARRDGTLIGEGSAVLVLERKDIALARNGVVLAELRGHAISSDTYHMTAPDPSGAGAAAAMRMAITSSKMSALEIDYVNAHGTGTLFNDVMETNAVKRVFGERAWQIPMSSTKSMIGHTLGAAGAIELSASILAMNAGFLPPTINYETRDKKCDLDYVPNEARPARIRAFLTNSFGFGGTNCSLLVCASRATSDLRSSSAD